MVQPEIWMPVIGFEGFYECSSEGNIKALDRVVKNVYAEYIRPERLLKTKLSNKGYPSISLTNARGRMKTYYVHILILSSFNPHIHSVNRITVNHRDGIKYHNWIGNLEWNTYSKNCLHAFANGLHIVVRGEKNGVSKMTEIQIREIREKGKYMGQRQLGREYGVVHSTIDKILTQKTWSHV